MKKKTAISVSTNLLHVLSHALTPGSLPNHSHPPRIAHHAVLLAVTVILGTHSFSSYGSRWPLMSILSV